MKRFLCITMAVLFLLTFVSCSQKSKKKDDSAEQVMTPQEIGGTTPIPHTQSFEIEEVEPCKTPYSESMTAFGYPSDIDEFFATLNTVVLGEVTGVKEYKLLATNDEDGSLEGTTYFTRIKLRVQENYGDAELIYRKSDTIHIMYSANTHDRQTDMSTKQDIPMLKKGDICIMFLTDINNLTGDSKKTLKKKVDYDIDFPMQSVIIFKDGYANAQGFMQLAGGTKEQYSLSELEKTIKDNKSKIRNITRRQLTQEIFGD